MTNELKKLERLYDQKQKILKLEKDLIDSRRQLLSMKAIVKRDESDLLVMKQSLLDMI